MLTSRSAFSGIAVSDIETAKTFYVDVLGATIKDEGMGTALLAFDRYTVLLYPRENHTPAAHTVLNFNVASASAAVDQLVSAGVTMEHYDDFPQDEKGIMRDNGPTIAWFRDPAGNVLSVIED